MILKRGITMDDRQKRTIFRAIIRDTGNSIRRNSFMSLASVFSIMAALVILGLFLILTINVRRLTTNVESSLEVQVFLTEKCTDKEKAAIRSALENNELVATVTEESKAQALEKFSEELADYSDLLSTYSASDNPLPESFLVTAKDATQLGEIKTFAQTLGDGIEYVKYGEEYISALTTFNRFANYLSIAVTVVLSIIALLLIYNTIRITVFARRREIGIMKYVGATDRYIRAPFVLEGIVLGIIAALVALLALRGGYYYIMGILSGRTMLTLTSSLADPSTILLELSLFFVIYGVVIGAVGSAIAVRKFLNV